MRITIIFDDLACRIYDSGPSERYLIKDKWMNRKFPILDMETANVYGSYREAMMWIKKMYQNVKITRKYNNGNLTLEVK